MEIFDMTKRYFAEKAKWKKAGKPIRPKEKMEELFQICSSNECGQYIKNDENTGSCNVCGCNLKKDSLLLNKLAWSTTRCPLENPKWIEEPEFQEIEVTTEEIKTEEKIEAKVEDTKKDQQKTAGPSSPVKKKRGCGCGGK